MFASSYIQESKEIEVHLIRLGHSKSAGDLGRHATASGKK